MPQMLQKSHRRFRDSKVMLVSLIRLDPRTIVSLLLSH
jgi:hypothetical protein